MGREANIRPEDYIVISAFMIQGLKLKGVKLLAYAMIYGFSKDGGGCFYGSMSWMASWLGVSEKAARECVRALEENGLIIEVGTHIQGTRESKKYIIDQSKVNVVCNSLKAEIPEDIPSPHKNSGDDLSPHKSSGDHPTKVPVSPNKNSGDYIYDNIYNNINDNIEDRGKDSNSDVMAAAKKILEYLNEKTGRAYSLKNQAVIRYISARLREGYTIEDFKKVIDTKVSHWKGDATMEEYLRPTTLFAPIHFDDYLNQKPKTKQAEKKGNTNERFARFAGAF